ncbi:YncE family protein [Halocatena marina]|uniref:YncE family protein n=1 Tax=Halocatena marina TaxID=2934937 RepID=UPI00200F089A|nr:hypothetical protein [Halocatena marina]
MAANRISRRTFITTATAATIVSLAGCSGQSDDDLGQDQGQTSTENTSTDENVTSTEQQNNGTMENVIYSFSSGRISIIEPQNAEVVAEITEDLDDTGWGDPLLRPDNRRLFVNDGTNAQVIVINTEEQQIETRLDVGPDPAHIYQPLNNEVWTHSDEEGAFYIIDMTDLSVIDKVIAAQENTAHGKLAYHEQLGTTGYATNTNDPGIHVIDLEAKENTGFIETHNEGGTHAEKYNPVSNRLYVEGTGDARTAVVNPDKGSVETHYDLVGQIFNTPNDKYVVWVHEEQGVSVLDAEQGEFVAEISVEGGSDKIFFHEEGDTVYGFTANTQNSKAAVVDFDQLEVVDTVEVGDIHRPEDAPFLHRSGLTADDWFVTPASGDNVVSIVDASARELHKKVEVAEGTEKVAYVGSFK